MSLSELESCIQCTYPNNPDDCNNLHVYYTAGSISSIIGALIVMITYIFSSKLRQHPSVLIFARCICDIGLALSFLVLDSLNIHSIACHKHICEQMGAITLFFFLCSISYYAALQIDLFLSVNNPFSSPHSTAQHMHWIIILLSFIITVITRINYRFIYRTDLQYCSLSEFTDNQHHRINSISLILLYTPLCCVMFMSLLITTYSCRRLHRGLPNTFYIRRKAIFDCWVYCVVFMLYVTVIAITYFLNWNKQRNNDRDPIITKIFALACTTMGVIDCAVWFITIYSHRKINNNKLNIKMINEIESGRHLRQPTPLQPNDIPIPDSDDDFCDNASVKSWVSDNKKQWKRSYKKCCKHVGIAPTKGSDLGINEALRRELLAYTTDGIVQCVNEISSNQLFQRHFNEPKKTDYPNGLKDKNKYAIHISSVYIKHNHSLLEISENDNILQTKKINVFNCCPTIFTSNFVSNRFDDNKKPLIKVNSNNDKLLSINNESSQRNRGVGAVDETFSKISSNKRFTSYAPLVFRYIRRIILKMSDDEYCSSIIPQNENDQIKCLDHARSGAGRSGAFFYFTHDKRFIVKTISSHEVEHMLNILSDYVRHLFKYPSTILSRCIGLHSLTLYGHTQYFIIMENVFLSSDLQPSEKYDLKGSWVGRYTNYKLHSGQVMKDIDLKRFIILSKTKKNGVLKQLKYDTKFLSKHNIMDYSLLLGIYHIKIEYDDDDDDDGGDDCKHSDIDNNSIDLQLNDSLSNDHSINIRNINIADDSYSGGVRAQIIEGPGIYYFGIIDALQKYTFKKRLETWIRKWIQRLDVRGISCVPPDEYQLRFMRYMRAIFIADKKYKRKLNLVDCEFKKEQLQIYPPRHVIKNNLKNIKNTRHGSISYYNNNDKPYHIISSKSINQQKIKQSTSLPALNENLSNLMTPSPNTLNNLILINKRK